MAGEGAVIEAVEFQNYKALRQTTLPLGPFTLLVGPNGSGKSTALQALTLAKGGDLPSRSDVASAGAAPDDDVVVTLVVPAGGKRHRYDFRWTASDDRTSTTHGWRQGEGDASLSRSLREVGVYSLDAEAIARPTPIGPADAVLAPDGAGLVAVLHHLRDQEPQRFAALGAELSNWLPEFDQILFSWVDKTKRSLQLRTRLGGHKIDASALSQGTLIGLALLTLAYLPVPPAVVCLEEPDRALHPRLLRQAQDALYRLAFPSDFGESRPPVQVIATTHNPYFLDLFRDRPEAVVLADKTGLDVQFRRLVDIDHWQEIIEDTHIGEVWYTGLLGGVPAGV
jgi:predicted ATPase